MSARDIKTAKTAILSPNNYNLSPMRTARVANNFRQHAEQVHTLRQKNIPSQIRSNESVISREKYRNNSR